LARTAHASARATAATTRRALLARASRLSASLASAHLGRTGPKRLEKGTEMQTRYSWTATEHR
jgi:hypothetical protein